VFPVFRKDGNFLCPKNILRISSHRKKTPWTPIDAMEGSVLTPVMVCYILKMLEMKSY
jgi:hypothetical protein